MLHTVQWKHLANRNWTLSKWQKYSFYFAKNFPGKAASVRGEKKRCKYKVCVLGGERNRVCVCVCVFVASCFQAYAHRATASSPVGAFAVPRLGSHLYLSAFPPCLPADAISTHVVTDDSRCHSLTLRCLMSFFVY